MSFSGVFKVNKRGRVTLAHEYEGPVSFELPSIGYRFFGVATRSCNLSSGTDC